MFDKPYLNVSFCKAQTKLYFRYNFRLKLFDKPCLIFHSAKHKKIYAPDITFVSKCLTSPILTFRSRKYIKKI